MSRRTWPSLLLITYEFPSSIHGCRADGPLRPVVSSSRCAGIGKPEQREKEALPFDNTSVANLCETGTAVLLLLEVLLSTLSGLHDEQRRPSTAGCKGRFAADSLCKKRARKPHRRVRTPPPVTQTMFSWMLGGLASGVNWCEPCRAHPSSVIVWYMDCK